MIVIKKNCPIPGKIRYGFWWYRFNIQLQLPRG